MVPRQARSSRPAPGRTAPGRPALGRPAPGRPALGRPALGAARPRPSARGPVGITQSG